MSDITICYFDFPGGRGEDCRLALHVAGADFRDDRVKGSDWAERKSSTPFGALPVLTVDGRVLAQSNAILAYLGMTYGLLPSDPFEAARHLSLTSAVEDVRERVGKTTAIKDPAARKTAREDLAKGWMRGWCKNVSAQIGDGPFVGGADLSVADLKLFVLMKWFVSGGVDHISPDIFAPWPKLMGVYEAVKTHPRVIDWYA